MDNQKSDTAEIKAKIKDYFIEVEEDKFAKKKHVSCKEELGWNSNNSTLRKDNILSLQLNYEHTGEGDIVCFEFSYYDKNFLIRDYPLMYALCVFLVLDDDKTLELDNIYGVTYSYISTTQERMHGGSITCYNYLDYASIDIPVSEFIQIANANKIDYSIRFGGIKLEGTFSEDEMNIIKGFYNAVFDEDFEIDRLSNYINQEQEINASTPQSEESKNEGGCYIATMAYGSYEHPQVMLLRNFRDNYLARRNWGIRFIETYYKYSPKLVKRLEHKTAINQVVRRCLDLFIKIIK